ncbi:hypothetical protein ATANTOWER_016784 [Ataeniobius toweri]|uniref:Uncharacterized protein n=1 Tax=Ataeniobius toweri TaxID=208326 RepID=A0ABU7C864_9TELE|nr:hypothetical protein [Ataeniobius toweri]
MFPCADNMLKLVCSVSFLLHITFYTQFWADLIRKHPSMFVIPNTWLVANKKMDDFNSFISTLAFLFATVLCKVNSHLSCRQILLPELWISAGPPGLTLSS